MRASSRHRSESRARRQRWALYYRPEPYAALFIDCRVRGNAGHGITMGTLLLALCALALACRSECDGTCPAEATAVQCRVVRTAADDEYFRTTFPTPERLGAELSQILNNAGFLDAPCPVGTYVTKLMELARDRGLAPTVTLGPAIDVESGASSTAPECAPGTQKLENGQFYYCVEPEAAYDEAQRMGIIDGLDAEGFWAISAEIAADPCAICSPEADCHITAYGGGGYGTSCWPRADADSIVHAKAAGAGFKTLSARVPGSR